MRRRDSIELATFVIVYVAGMYVILQALRYAIG